MNVRRNDPIDEMHTLLATGFDIVEVDSTDHELVLTLWNGEHHHTVVLDAESARRLVIDELYEQRPLLA